MPPDSSDLDNALVAYLAADAALTALLPDGVYLDEISAGARAFALITIVDAIDVEVFSTAGPGYETVLYEITATVLAGTSANIKGAAARIHELLQDQTFPIPGYLLTACYREDRVRNIEKDEIDPDVRWFHRGGRYRIQASRVETVTANEVTAP